VLDARLDRAGALAGNATASLALAVYDAGAVAPATAHETHHSVDEFLPAWLLVYGSLLLFALALAFLHRLVRAALPADTESADALYFGTLIAPAATVADGDGAAVRLTPALREVLVASGAPGLVAGAAPSACKTPMGARTLNGSRPYGRKQ
jgi:hypothetical protein